MSRLMGVAIPLLEIFRNLGKILGIHALSRLPLNMLIRDCLWGLGFPSVRASSLYMWESLAFTGIFRLGVISDTLHLNFIAIGLAGKTER